MLKTKAATQRNRVSIPCFVSAWLACVSVFGADADARPGGISLVDKPSDTAPERRARKQPLLPTEPSLSPKPFV